MAEGYAQKQLKKMGDSSSKMSAFEVAALGKNLSSAALENETGQPVVTALEMDTEDEDWKPLIEQAKGNGPLSMFAQTVDFNLNEAHFVGKVGYSVKGGVLALFDGAAIDFNFSKMKSKKPKDAQSDPVLGEPSQYKNWVEGEGGMLVLAPVGMDNVVPVSMKHVTVTEKGMSGYANKHMEFHSHDMKLSAEKLTVTDDMAVLTDVTAAGAGDTAPSANLEAVITGSGVEIKKQESTPEDTPQAIQANEAENTEEAVTQDIENNENNDTNGGEPAVVINKSGEITQKDSENPEKKEDEKNEDEQNEGKNNEDIESSDIQDKVEEAVVGDNNNDANTNTDNVNPLGNEQFHDSNEKTLVEKVENIANKKAKEFVEGSGEDENKDTDENKGFVQEIVEGTEEAVIDAAKTLAVTALMGVSDDDENKTSETTGKVKLREGSAAIVTQKADNEKEDKNAFQQAAHGVAEQAGEMAHNALKAGKDAVLNNIDPKNTDVSVLDTVKNSFIEQGKGKKEQAGELWENAKNAEVKGTAKTVYNSIKAKEVNEKNVQQTVEDAFSLPKLREFLGMSEDDSSDEASSDEDLASRSKTFALLAIPILPFVNFSVELTPSYLFQPYIKGSVSKLWNILEKDKNSENAVLEFEAGLKNSLSLEAKASLKEGIPYIIQGYQSLKAAANLKGNVKQKEDALAKQDLVGVSASVKVPIHRGPNGTIEQADDMKIEVKGGYDLKGSVGAEVGVESKILSWNKTFVEKTFAEWDLLTISLNLGLSKSKDTGIFKGWTLDEAAIAMESGGGMGKAFTEKNTPERLYGLTKPDTKEPQEYSNLQNDFKAALKMLKRVKNEEKNETLLIPTNPADSGYVDMMKNLQANIAKFGGIWAQAQRILEYTMQQLKAYNESESFGKGRENELDSDVRKHQSRIDAMNKGKERAGGKKFDAYSYYRNLSDGPGIGFDRYLKEKAKNSVYTFDVIAKYEKNRYKEVTSDYTKNINKLKQAIEGEKKNGKVVKKSDKEIVKQYKKDAGDDAFKHKAMFQSKEALIKFLKNKMWEDTKEEKEHLTDTMGIAEQGTDFFKKYAKNLNKNTHRDILYRFGSAKILMDYEEGRLKKETGEDFNNYQSKKSLDSKNKNDNKLKETITNELEKTATIDELIEFERQENKGKKGKQLETFKKRMEKRTAEENIRYITIKLLIEYARKRKDKTENIYEKKVIADELFFLYQSQVILDSVYQSAPDKAVDAEAEEVKKYFNRYTKTGAQYQADLESGAEENVSLMHDVLYDNPDNAKMKILTEGKEKGMSDTEIVMAYLGADGVNKKGLQEFLLKKNKGADGEISIDESRLNRYFRFNIREKNDKHYDRYMKLKEIYADGNETNYAAMLRKYESIGGGEGYAEMILKELKEKGAVKDQVFTKNTAFEFENINVKQHEKKYQDKIDLIAEMSKKGMSDREIIAEYEKGEQKEWGYIKGILSKVINFKSDFEDSLKDVELTPQQLLEYEIIRRDEAGEKHALRIKALYGLDKSQKLPDDLDSLTPPPADKMEENRLEYLKVAKRITSEKENEEKEKEELARLMKSDSMADEIISYEEGRKAHYKEEYDKQVKVRTDMEERIDTLNKEIKLSRSIASNVSKLEEQPKIIFDQISDFEEAVGWTEEAEKKKEDMEQENKKINNEIKEISEA